MVVNIKELLAKATVSLFFIYILWYAEAIGDAIIVLYGSACLVVISTLIMINGKTYRLAKPSMGLRIWILYAVLSLVFGFLVAKNFDILVSSLVTFLAFLCICICVNIICNTLGDIEWVLHILIFIAVLCAAYTLLFGFDYYNGIYVKTMSANNNPNTLGVMMVVGSFCTLYIVKNNIRSILCTLAMNALFLYIIIICGSKKALLAVALLLLFWGYLFIKEIFKNAKTYMKIFSIITGIIVLFAIFYYLTHYYINTVSFQRLMIASESGSTKLRTGMYEEAIKMFKASPICGQGYNQFIVLSSSGKYSHSTYAELISCGGIIGTFTFMLPIVIGGIQLIKNARREFNYKTGLIMNLFCVEIFLGAVNIYMYEFIHLIVWTIIFISIEKSGFILERECLNG